LQPVTAEGQILAGLVIFVGLGLLGFVSARLTARWLNQENDSALTSAEVKSLRRELSEIKELLNRALDSREPSDGGPHSLADPQTIAIGASVA